MNKLLSSFLFLLLVLFLLSSCNKEKIKHQGIIDGTLSNKEKIKYKGIDRTLSLLKNSTKETPNEVNVFFYGQSIVGGMNPKVLVESLSAKYPNAKINYKQKAIGGFQVPLLIKTINHDLYHENPDLILFHAYGGIKDTLFDNLIKNIRKKLSSDILLFDHHYRWDIPSEKLESLNKSEDFDSKEIEKIAKKYDCGFINLREQWKDYLEENNLKANELMGNTIDPNVHPNKEGNQLLRQIILKKFEDKEFKKYSYEKDSLREVIEIDKNTKHIVEEFLGNRLEVEIDKIEKEAALEVFINGKKPSEILGTYYISRPSRGFKNWMPAITRVSFGNTFPRKEGWTIRIWNINRKTHEFKYDLNGSITGFDGQGTSLEDFESNSGRISIKHKDFLIFKIEKISKKETPNNFEINFDVKKIVEDTLKITSKKTNYTLFKGVKSSKYKLDLKILKGDVTFKKIISYKPYLSN